MTPTEASDAAMKAVFELDANAQLLWDLPGPKDTAIRKLSCYSVHLAPDGRQRTLIVQVFGDRRGEDTGGGWIILPELGLIDIEGTMACLRRLDAFEAAPSFHPLHRDIAKANPWKPIADMPRDKAFLVRTAKFTPWPTPGSEKSVQIGIRQERPAGGPDTVWTKEGAFPIERTADHDKIDPFPGLWEEYAEIPA